jgi:hypothetical protein
LSKQYQINYSEETLKFKSEADLNAYLQKNLTNPNFLCYENISVEVPGICYITVKVETQKEAASIGWQIIESDLKKLGANKEDDYVIGYSPSLETPGMYKYSVGLSKELYDKLNNAAYVKGPWIKSMKEIITYWKK